MQLFSDLAHLTLDVRTTLGFRPLGVFVKTSSKLTIRHSHKKYWDQQVIKGLFFCVTVVVIDKLHRTGQI